MKSLLGRDKSNGDVKRCQSASPLTAGVMGPDLLRVAMAATGVYLIYSAFKKEKAGGSSGKIKAHSERCASMVFDKMDAFYSRVRSTYPEFRVIRGNLQANIPDKVVYSYETITGVASDRIRGLQFGHSEARELILAFEELDWVLVTLAKNGFVLKNIWKTQTSSTEYITPALLAYRAYSMLFEILWNDKNESLRSKDAKPEDKAAAARIAADIRVLSRALFEEAANILSSPQTSQAVGNSLEECDDDSKYATLKMAKHNWCTTLLKPTDNYTGAILLCMDRDDSVVAELGSTMSCADFCRNYVEASKWIRELLSKGKAPQDLVYVCAEVKAWERDYWDNLKNNPVDPDDTKASAESRVLGLVSKVFSALSSGNKENIDCAVLAAKNSKYWDRVEEVATRFGLAL